MTTQGYCQCGCGARTWIATKSSEKDGWTKGQPVRFARKTHCVHGHPLSGDNLYEWGTRRYCRACRERLNGSREGTSSGSNVGSKAA